MSSIQNWGKVRKQIIGHLSENERQLSYLGDIDELRISDNFAALALIDEYGRTVLHYASQFGHRIVYAYTKLIRIINAHDYDGRTALHLACIPADSTFSNAYGFAILQTEDFERACKILVENGANINSQDSEDRTALHYAAMHNQDLVPVLISLNANVFAIDENGKAPLDYAFQLGKTTAIKALVEHFANQKEDEKGLIMKDINCVDEEGRNILHRAAEVANTAAITKLLHAGIGFNAVDKHGKSALDHALAWPANVEGALVLLSSILRERKGKKDHLPVTVIKNLEVKDSVARTILHYSVMHFKQNVLDALLKNKVSLNDIDYSGMSALHFAAERGNVLAAEKLLEAGASVKGRDGKKRTVLHHAIQHGDENILDLLIKNKANVNDRDNKGKSPLHYASERGNTIAATRLLEAGANVEGKDERGQTVLHLAIQNGDEQILELLIKNNARVNDTDNRGNLHYITR